MARTSRNGAQEPSVNALDNIDIDDMFGDGGDGLFDDLDMDLDKMGDIVNNFEGKKDDPIVPQDEAVIPETASPVAAPATAPAPAPAPTPVHSRTPAPAPSLPQADDPPRRRKTKRKTKSPVLLDEEEDAEEESSKKKRKTKTKSEKKKGSKKQQVDESQTQQAVQSKSKANKNRTSLSMPPPLSRPPSSATGVVAAAGQFGGRSKRGHFSLPLARSTSEKLKSKSKTSVQKVASAPAPVSDDTATPTITKTKSRQSSTPAPASAAVSSADTSSKPVATAISASQQSAFCGLLPSNTLFYPFMPALPSEPSIKNRKLYPVIDRINSSFMSFMNTSSNISKVINGVNPASEAEAIYRLMQETLKEVNTPSSSVLSPEQQAKDKQLAVSNAIGSLRRTISHLEKSRLTGDLFSICALLKRQHDFIKQNLSNMERWCKDNFSDSDFSLTYGMDLSAATRKKKLAGSGSLIGSMIAQSGKPLLKVKLKCSGFKEPKSLGSLVAMVPPSMWGGAIHPTLVTGNEQLKSGKITNKKRKLSASEASQVASGTVCSIVSKSTRKTISYVDGKPTKRRLYISEVISQTAKDLETVFLQASEDRRQVLDRQQNETRKLVEDDDVVVIHTAAMWRWIEKSGFFAEFTEDSVRDCLRTIWAPEIRQAARGSSRELPQFQIRPIKWSKPEQKQRKQSADSLFDRLQSLLVEETSDSEDDEENELLFHDELDEPQSELNIDVASEHLNLSELTINERTFLHLRASGLVDNASLSAIGSIASDFLRNSERPRITNDHSPGIEDVIDAMSRDLISLNTMNNGRAAFLESASKSHLIEMKELKERREEESSLIVKCQQLLKKNAKESRTKNSKPKVSTKDDIALPW